MKKNYFNIPNLLTFFNIICGLTSIYFSIEKNFKLAALFLFFCVLFDFFDGKIARYLNQESEIGKNLDSLADLTSFGIAPVIFVSLLNDLLIIYLLSILFVCSGAYRLARFNITKKKLFEGMPITLNGIIFPTLFFINSNYYVYIIVLIITSFLMISKIKVKRL